MGHTKAAVLVVVLAVAVLGLATDGQAQLQNGFYTGKCRGNDVEAVVRGIVKARVAQDSAIVAHLLRLLFHECGVNVCIIMTLGSYVRTIHSSTPHLSSIDGLITNLFDYTCVGLRRRAADRRPRDREDGKAEPEREGLRPHHHHQDGT